jgi:hypothetical protein
VSVTASGGESHRSSYYKNGELHVNVLGQPEGKPITTGHWDFKPSWSQTGNMLAFFRRLKNDPGVGKWITAMCIINVDGTSFHQLSDGTYTDFNPTWTRDGTNTPVWNRKNRESGRYYIMSSKVGGKPGEEVALTDNSYGSWVHSAVSDGRLLVASSPPQLGRGYYLMTPHPGGEPKFERIKCEMAKTGILDRVSVPPGETRNCCEYQTGFEHDRVGRTLYIAYFDVPQRTITNARPFANEEGQRVWFAYPRWTKDESAIVHHAAGKLFLYTLSDGSTQQVSTDDKADYRYPLGEATPN